MAVTSLEGQNLGKYRVLEPLGSGGMARVYRGYHPQLDRFVAIKVLRSDLVEDETFLGRFRREAQSVATLRHPNIIQVHDFDVQDGIYFMVMELLDGDTLHTRLNDYRVRDEQIPWGEMVRILLDILAGLDYAHQEGMIHRDIKPANVLLTRRGQAVIADFGIAQIVGGTRHTVSGALLGTLNYMAPEQGLKGESDVRSDIYSVGVLFYEMLTRQPPFDADTPLAILMKHVNDPLPLPRDVNPDIPLPFERVVLKALAKQPEDRYQSAGEMAAAVQEAAVTAELDVPTQISLPLSFTTHAAPAESVAVFSGTARAKLREAEFAAEETSATQISDWEAQVASLKEAETQVMADVEKGETAVSPAAAPHEAHNIDTAVPAAKGKPVILALLANAGRLVYALAGQAGQYLRTNSLAVERVGTVRAIINGIGLILIVNMVIIMLAGVAGPGRFFGRGWPVELFLVAILLLHLMASLRQLWLFIPAGILLGNAFLLSYYSLSGNWQHWAFLWPLEVFIVLGVVLFTINAAINRERVQNLSVQLGDLLGRVAFIGLLLVAILAFIV